MRTHTNRFGIYYGPFFIHFRKVSNLWILRVRFHVKKTGRYVVRTKVLINFINMHSTLFLMYFIKTYGVGY